MARSTAVKLALSRRTTSDVEGSGGTWRTEFFNVTQDVIDANKITLALAPILDTEILKLNGLEMVNHPDWDYQMDGANVVFGEDILLIVGDTIRARYKA